MVSKIFKKDEKETPALILELSFAGQMSIWGLRLLASGYRAEIDMTKALIDGFRRCNAVQAGSNLLFLLGKDVLFFNSVLELNSE